MEHLKVKHFMRPGASAIEVDVPKVPRSLYASDTLTHLCELVKLYIHKANIGLQTNTNNRACVAPSDHQTSSF